MSKVKCFQMAGIELWFISGDHTPPHFHARKPGEWSMVVEFLNPEEEMFRSIKPPNANIKGKERRELIQNVITHRAELLTEWEACQAKD